MNNNECMNIFQFMMMFILSFIVAVLPLVIIKIVHIHLRCEFITFLFLPLQTIQITVCHVLLVGLLSWHGSHFWVCIKFCKVRHGDSVTKPDYYYYYYSLAREHSSRFRSCKIIKVLSTWSHQENFENIFSGTGCYLCLITGMQSNFCCVIQNFVWCHWV